MAIAKKKKRFLEVEIPLIGKTTFARSFEKEELNGRYLNYDMTRLLRGKGAILQLKISADKEKAIANPTQLVLMPFYLQRMVRKGTNYVEDSFVVDSKNAKIQIKPFLVTRNKVSRAVRKALREKCREEIINYVKDKTVGIIFKEILKGSYQKSLALVLKKVYPLAFCDIKNIRVKGEVKFDEEVSENFEDISVESSDIPEEKPAKKKKSKEAGKTD